MLAIGPWLPPHNGACVVVHPGTGPGDGLAVGLHVALEWRQKLNPLPAAFPLYELCLDPSWGAPASRGDPANVGPQAPELSGLDYHAVRAMIRRR